MIKKLFRISKRNNTVIIDIGNNYSYKVSEEFIEALLEEMQRIDEKVMLSHGVNSNLKIIFENIITEIEKHH